jgi:hypothetical protein
MTYYEQELPVVKILCSYCGGYELEGDPRVYEGNTTESDMTLHGAIQGTRHVCADCMITVLDEFFGGPVDEKI